MTVRPGEVLAAVGGAALIASLFGDWYGARARAAGATGWQAFGILDVLLTLLALMAFALLAAQATRRTPALPVALAVLTSTAGLVAVLLVLYRLIDQPGPNEFFEVRAAAWMGLAATAAVFGGAWWSLTDERPRLEPAEPEPELRAAPPAA